MRHIIASALALSLAAQPALASGCATDAMLVFDGSASMAELGFDPTAPTRMDDARAAMHRAMPRIAPVRRVGLIIYGPGPEGSCDGINLHFTPQPDAADALTGAIDRADQIGRASGMERVSVLV